MICINMLIRSHHQEKAVVRLWGHVFYIKGLNVTLTSCIFHFAHLASHGHLYIIQNINEKREMPPKSAD